jgi:hypothetical protein
MSLQAVETANLNYPLGREPLVDRVCHQIRQSNNSPTKDFTIGIHDGTGQHRPCELQHS